jgi:hypothetical protein
MTAMTPPQFRVLLDDGTEHLVSVHLGDQLRAELEAGVQGLPVKFEAAPAHHTALWLWAGLTRMGVTDQKFREFRDRMVLVARVEDPPPADPTQQGPGTASP